MNEELLRIVVSPEESGLTVRDLLQKNYGVSRRLLISAKYSGVISRNGTLVYVNEKVAEGDVIQVTLPDESAETLEPEPMSLVIRYEDEDLLLIAKPPGLVVHPTRTHPNGTLANGVVAYWLAKGESRKFRPINRLDKDTSGLLLVAKNQWAHEQCSRMQQDKTMKRTYQAIVHGVVAEDQGLIDAPIGLKETSIIEREVREDGQSARTHFTVLARGNEATWVELSLETGRTHQIRVHMNYLGHPLLGDDLYGGIRNEIGRQALHAVRLQFNHPRTKQIQIFTDPLPDDMAELVRKIKQKKL
ncbi:RluA family pseudouridine synthase [Brevibacillus sp. SYSU BS000544]|uniref:RluA family pseudouridine synthase n=1 Tax=Brevibacillus sp. SYSU BS000544 TaxID=3416443 RepID=UPI003CE55644